MQTVLEQIIIITIITVIGYIGAKLRLIPSSAKRSLSRMVIEVAVPAALIASGSLSIHGADWYRVLIVLGISFVFHLVLFYGMKWFGIRLFSNRQKGFIAVLAVCFGNVMFVGFPVVRGIYGQEGLFLASIFVIAFNVLIYTIGIRLINHTDKIPLKKMLLTPFNVALLIMFILLITQYKLPHAIQYTAEVLGNLCTPLSLLVIGAMIAEANLIDVFKDRALWLVSIIRVLIVPIIMIGVMWLLPIDVLTKQTIIALSAMPGAAMTAMIAEQYNCEPRFGSLSVVQSTLLFLVTFPFIIYLSHLIFN